MLREASQLLDSREESKSGAIFRQQAESRAGAATEPSDGEARVVADSSPAYHSKKITPQLRG